MIHESDDDPVRECYRLASSARAEAMRESDLACRAAFFTMEDCWIGLAQSFQLIESISDFGKEVQRRYPVGGLMTGGEHQSGRDAAPEPLPYSGRGVQAFAPDNNGVGNMGRAQEQQHLAKADDCIERQCAIIAKLKNDGHATDTAEKILATMLRSRDLLERRRSLTLEALALHQMNCIPVSHPTMAPDRAAGNGGPSQGAVDGA